MKIEVASWETIYIYPMSIWYTYMWTSTYMQWFKGKRGNDLREKEERSNLAEVWLGDIREDENGEYTGAGIHIYMCVYLWWEADVKACEYVRLVTLFFNL